MMTLELDLSVVQKKQELMEWLRKGFDFPSYFGGNWDAVEECFYDSCTEDILVEIINESDISDEMEDELPRLEKIIRNFNASGEISIILERMDE